MIQNIMSSYLVCIPTYNEAENIDSILDRVLALNIPDLAVLVIDDKSPDGTAAIVERRSDSRIHLLKREKKEGLGPAYLAAFAWGMNSGFDYFIEMDADGSHQPEELPALLAASDHSDLVLGTRWMPGGSVHNWPIYRKAISRIGTRYAQFALKMPYRDLTGGFRVISRNLLETVDIPQIETLGYGFQIEMAMRTFDAGLSISEVPITFIERVRGASKMNNQIVFEALVKTTQWGFQRRLNRR